MSTNRKLKIISFHSNCIVLLILNIIINFRIVQNWIYLYGYLFLDNCVTIFNVGYSVLKKSTCTYFLGSFASRFPPVNEY